MVWVSESRCLGIRHQLYYATLQITWYLSIVDRFSDWISVYHFQPYNSTTKKLIDIFWSLFIAYAVPGDTSSDGVQNYIDFIYIILTILGSSTSIVISWSGTWTISGTMTKRNTGVCKTTLLKNPASKTAKFHMVEACKNHVIWLNGSMKTCFSSLDFPKARKMR